MSLGRPSRPRGRTDVRRALAPRPPSSPARTLRTLLVCLWLAACAGAPPQGAAPPSVPPGAPPGSVPLYVVKRGSHVDVGIAAGDVQSPLAPVAASFPDSRYLLFGFGDRRYLLDAGAGHMVAALWGGAGLVLLTSLEAQRPEDVFGADAVVRLAVTPRQMGELQRAVAASLATHEGQFTPVTPGPHAVVGYSAFYESVQHYSALHTCNTWAAEVLQSAGLPVTSSGVEFSSELWSQVERLKETGGAAPVAPAPAP